MNPTDRMNIIYKPKQNFLSQREIPFPGHKSTFDSRFYPSNKNAIFVHETRKQE